MYKAVWNCGAAGDFTGETRGEAEATMELWVFTGKTALRHEWVGHRVYFWPSSLYYFPLSYILQIHFSTNTCSGKHIISNVSSEVDISGRSKIKDVCWYFVEVSVYRIIIVIVIWHWIISYLDSFFVHKRTNDRIFWSLLEEYKAYLLLFLKFFLMLCLKQKSF